jgi:hypothetical protein
MSNKKKTPTEGQPAQLKLNAIIIPTEKPLSKPKAKRQGKLSKPFLEIRLFIPLSLQHLLEGLQDD